MKDNPFIERVNSEAKGRLWKALSYPWSVTFKPRLSYVEFCRLNDFSIVDDKDETNYHMTKAQRLNREAMAAYILLHKAMGVMHK